MSWTGEVVRRELGVTVEGPDETRFRELAGLAVRRNTKRAHLVVSTVLAKHVPARPSTVLAASYELGSLVAETVAGAGTVLVIGFAETATGLGHQVAEVVPSARYVHSTRSPGPSPLLAFAEEHSHATAHYIDLADDTWLLADAIVLVDDELSTGRTAENIIASLVPKTTCRTFVLASIIDSRSPSDHERTNAMAAGLGVTLRHVALVHPSMVVPASALASAARMSELPHAESGERGSTSTSWRALRFDSTNALDGSRGIDHHGRAAIAEFASSIARELQGGLPRDLEIVVLGVEEFMALPVLVAHQLELSGMLVSCQSTTRSPVVALDVDGYAIRSALTFTGPAGDDRYLYNLPRDAGAYVVVAPPGVAQGLLGALAQSGIPVLSVEVSEHG